MIPIDLTGLEALARRRLTTEGRIERAYELTHECLGLARRDFERAALEPEHSERRVALFYSALIMLRLAHDARGFARGFRIDLRERRRDDARSQRGRREHVRRLMWETSPEGQASRARVQALVSPEREVTDKPCSHAKLVSVDENDDRIRTRHVCAVSLCGSWSGCYAKRLDEEGREAWGPPGVWTYRRTTEGR